MEWTLINNGDEFSEVKCLREKLKGHQYSTIHCYNKATKRMNKILTCNYEGCGKQFTKTWNILDHFKIHTRERSHLCDSIATKPFLKMVILQSIESFMKKERLKEWLFQSIIIFTNTISKSLAFALIMRN